MTDSIRVSLHVTHNLGNYNSLKLGADKEHSLDEGEDVKAAWASLWEEIQEQVEEQLKNAHEDG